MSGKEILLHHARVPAGLEAGLQARWLASLPDTLSARISRMHHARDRAATLLGIALLRHCAGAAGFEPPPPASLAFPSHGKPVWPSGPDFSITHSAMYAGCALAPVRFRVGLDMEQRGGAAGSDLRLVASDRERALYAASGLSPDDLWTAKEAVLKAAGAGIRDAGQVRLEADTATFRGTRYVLLRPPVAADCCCTLAATGPAEVVVVAADADELLEAVA
jgi:phosphopantetheinyl transferase